MGLIDELDKLDLADDVKARLRQEHESEVQTKDEELTTLRSKDRRESVEAEVTELSDAGFKFPGALAYMRRVLLSDDKEPGTILLSDADMQLSGDQATGATTREEISTADVLRKFVSLIPRNDAGKIELSEMLLAEQDHGRPEEDDDDPEKKTQGARERLGKISGFTGERTRKRYSGRVVAGGDA